LFCKFRMSTAVQPVVPKAATTILSLAAIRGKAYDYEVLMMRRSDKARFMPGAHVFPGGVAEPCDWDRLFESSVQKFSDLQQRITGIRELFEETGVLLTQPRASDASTVEPWRDRIQQDATQFVEMCKTLNIRPDTSCLHPWTRLITPLREKYRYDTFFYVASLAEKPSVRIQEREATQFDWFTPAEAISRFHKQEIWLPPPTYLVLLEMSGFVSASALLAHADKQDMAPVTPEWQPSGDDGHFVIAWPGDTLHPDTKNNSMKNRLIMRGKYDYVVERSVVGKAAL